MKEITKSEMDLLIQKGILISTGRGMMDKRGSLVSYSRTRHKRYIMDKYADIAHNLSQSLYCE